MNKNYFILFFLLLLSCTNNLEIEQDKVKETLLNYGSENHENEVIIKTNFGPIELKLYNETPLHRANFIRLIKNGYYSDRKIYRIVKGLCIQGGANSYDKLKYTVQAEFKPNLIHKYGALAMARYSDNNPTKMSSASEFFIITKSVFYEENELSKYTESLKNIYKKIGGEINFDNEYTVFGEVTKGMEIVEKIASLELVDLEKPLEMPTFSIELK